MRNFTALIALFYMSFEIKNQFHLIFTIQIRFLPLNFIKLFTYDFIQFNFDWKVFEFCQIQEVSL